MPQGFLSTLPADNELFSTLAAVIRTNLIALNTHHSGTSAPTSPQDRQFWLDTSVTPNKLKIYDQATTTWKDFDLIDIIIKEVKDARGTAASLDARLDQALNEDGTLKAATTLNPDEWKAITTAPTKLSATQFRKAGVDQTAIYHAKRRVKMTPGPNYGTVASSVFTGGNTDVTLEESTVPDGITAADAAIISSQAASTAYMAKSLPIADADGIVAATDAEAALKEIFDRVAQVMTEALQAYVESGGTGPTSGTLSHDIAAVVAYPSGYRVTRALENHTYTASKDTYVYILKNGTYSFLEVANGAGEPAQPADSLKLMKVVTDGTTITGVTDLRLLNPFPGPGSGYEDFKEITAPAAPAVDTVRLYAKDDGGTTRLAYKDSAGAEVLVAGGSTYVSVDPVVSKVSRTTTVGFTAVSIASDTGTDTAKAAVLQVEVKYNADSSDDGCLTHIRPGGSSDATGRIIEIRTGVTSGNPIQAAAVIVGLDGSEQFEYDLGDIGTPTGRELNIWLVGYFK